MKKTIVIDNSIIVFVATMAPTVAFAAVAELEREYILQCQREGHPFPVQRSVSILLTMKKTASW